MAKKEILPALPVCDKGGYHEVKDITAFDPKIPEDKEYLDDTDCKFYATCVKCGYRIVAEEIEEYEGHHA